MGPIAKLVKLPEAGGERGCRTYLCGVQGTQADRKTGAAFSVRSGPSDQQNPELPTKPPSPPAWLIHSQPDLIPQPPGPTLTLFLGRTKSVPRSNFAAH